jgi:hypothetical protein
MADAIVVPGGRFGPAAHRLSPHVLEIESADHGMFVPGPIQNSIAGLTPVVAAINDFLDAINWPDR